MHIFSNQTKFQDAANSLIDFNSFTILLDENHKPEFIGSKAWKESFHGELAVAYTRRKDKAIIIISNSF